MKAIYTSRYNIWNYLIWQKAGFFVNFFQKYMMLNSYWDWDQQAVTFTVNVTKSPYMAVTFYVVPSTPSGKDIRYFGEAVKTSNKPRVYKLVNDLMLQLHFPQLQITVIRSNNSWDIKIE